MRTVSAFLTIVLSLPTLSAIGADPDDERQQAAKAREILNAWHRERIEPVEKFVHVICWTPADREFPANDQERLTRIMTYIQSFYRREMERYGFENRTFRLQFDERKRLVIHRVRGRKPTARYGKSSGHEIREECLETLRQAGIDPANETLLIMCNLAKWDEKQLRFQHNSPYYASGSYRNGTAWQLDSPELDTRNLKAKTPIISDGEYGRISLGKHNSIFIGGIAHELGHALGLPHCTARPDERYRGRALMGSGNRTFGDELRGEGGGSFLTLAHALRLASHPTFTGSRRGLDQRGTASVENLSIDAEGTTIRIQGRMIATPPVYALVAYFDPEGRGDYDATTATCIPNENGNFELRCSALFPGKEGEVRLFPLHVNGSAGQQMSRTNIRYSYMVDQRGVPDVSIARTRIALEPIVEAMSRRDRPKAQRLASKLKDRTAIAITTRLLATKEPMLTPADVRPDVVKIGLTDTKSSSARVGWMRPVRDKIPGPAVLLESGGRIFETGLYAHAPARHLYELDGRWNTISGQIGIANTMRGTVRFELKGDGKTLWRSGVVRSGRPQPFEVSVEGVHRLELLTDPTADGSGSDWALWLQPTLTRPQP